MEDRDPYEILKIASNTEPEVIEAVYRMILVRNQNTGISGPEVTQQLQDAQWAYEMLRDPEKRREYDERTLRQQPVVQPQTADPTRRAPRKVKRIRSSNLVSTMLSFSLFVLMLAAVGAALYLVGAVPGVGNAKDVVGPSAALVASPTLEATFERDQGITRAHTATVAAMSKAATESAMTDEEALTTATSEAGLTQDNPTPVAVQGCPSVSSINVRTGPGAAYPSVGFILDSDCVILSGRNMASTWAVVGKTPEEELEGQWVALSVLTVSGSIEGLPVVDVPGPPPASDLTATVMPSNGSTQSDPSP